MDIGIAPTARKLFFTSAILASFASSAGAGPSGSSSPTLTIGAARTVGTFNYGYSQGYTMAVRDLYPVDLDQDGREEVILAGFETQPNSPETYHNTRMAVFGWRGDAFVNLTSKWLPGVDRIEGTNDLAIGDFNGDGRTDIFTTAYTDMNHPAYTYEFTNRNGYFTRRQVDRAVWQHGVTKARLNADDYDDVVVSGYGESVYYLGGPNGLTPHAPLNYMAEHNVSAYNIGGSDIVAAPFTRGASDDLVVVDSLQDTVLLDAIEGDAGMFGFEQLSVLPPPPMSVGANPPGSHDVRVMAADFNSDGLTDVVVLSRADATDQGWPERSTLQFMKNNGNGTFADVTGTVLVGFTRNSTIPYHPIIDDFNLDGRADIFLSYSDYNDTVNSHALLMQNSEGKFVETDRAQLSKFVESMGAMATILRRGNEIFLVKDAQEYFGKSTISIAPISFPQRKTSETLRGTALPDRIWGFAGNDRMFGLEGGDRLVGGEGADLVDLGQDEAVDYAVYQSTGESTKRQADTVANFDVSRDKIDLGAIDANRKLAGNQAFRFSGRVPAPNSVWHARRGAELVVRGDTNGNALPDFEIIIQGGGSLTAKNFVL